MKSKLLLLCALSLLFSTSIACTNITIKSDDGAVVIGRTLEFGPSLNSNIISSNRGRQYSNVAPNGKQSLNWEAKYGYLYLNAFNQSFATDGMNEKGLSIGFLYLPGYTEYPKLKEENTKNGIAYFQLGDWILSQFETTDDVKNALKNINVFDQPLDIPGHGKVSFPVHTIVTDATGKSIVVEFTKGKMKVFDNPLGVLTNSPTFDWQMNNLKNYVNLTPFAPKPLTVDGFEYSATGQGAGMFGLPGDTTPPSRFVKMALLTQAAKPVQNAKDAVVLAYHIIENVFIPDGVVRGAKGSDDTETTQWTVFKDLKNKVLYFKSYHYPMLQSIDLKALNFNQDAPVFSMPVASEVDLSVDKTKFFKKDLK